MPRPLFFVLFLFSFSLHGQAPAKLDSLEKALLPFTAGDTLRFPLLNELFNLTAYSDMARARGYARQTVRLGKEAHLPVYEAEGYQRLGIAFENEDVFDSAVHYYNRAIDLYRQEGLRYGEGTTRYNMSIVYQRQGKYDLAREQLRLAREAYAGLDRPKDQADVLNVLAQIERETGNFEGGLQAALEAVALVQPTGDSAAIIAAEQEIGVNYKMLKNYDLAIEYLERQYSWYLRQNDLYFATASLSILADAYAISGDLDRAIAAGEKTLAMLAPAGLEAVEISARNNLAGFHADAGDYAKAEQEYLLALGLVHAEGDDRRRARILTELCAMQFRLGKLSEARQNAQLAIALNRQLGMREPEMDARGHLAEIAAASGDYRTAYAQLQQRQTLQDSLYQTELAGKLVELTAKYEKEKQDRLISEQQNQLQLLASQARVDRWQKTALALGGAALLLLLAGVWYAYRQRHLRQRAREEQLRDKVQGQQKELSTHALSMARKGQLLDQLSEELQQLKGKDSADRKRLDGLLRNLNSEERIDQDWDNFRTYFSGVHAGFEDRLRTTSTQDLSLRELRLAALIRMQLNNQEIGAILGISQDSLYKAKYRLRKKLPEVEQGELDNYLREV